MADEWKRDERIQSRTRVFAANTHVENEPLMQRLTADRLSRDAPDKPGAGPVPSSSQFQPPASFATNEEFAPEHNMGGYARPYADHRYMPPGPGAYPPHAYYMPPAVPAGYYPAPPACAQCHPCPHRYDGGYGLCFAPTYPPPQPYGHAYSFCPQAVAPQNPPVPAAASPAVRYPASYKPEGKPYPQAETRQAFQPRSDASPESMRDVETPVSKPYFQFNPPEPVYRYSGSNQPLYDADGEPSFPEAHENDRAARNHGEPIEPPAYPVAGLREPPGSPSAFPEVMPNDSGLPYAGRQEPAAGEPEGFAPEPQQDRFLVTADSSVDQAEVDVASFRQAAQDAMEVSGQVHQADGMPKPPPASIPAVSQAGASIYSQPYPDPVASAEEQPFDDFGPNSESLLVSADDLPAFAPQVDAREHAQPVWDDDDSTPSSGSLLVSHEDSEAPDINNTDFPFVHEPETGYQEANPWEDPLLYPAQLGTNVGAYLPNDEDVTPDQQAFTPPSPISFPVEQIEDVDDGFGDDEFASHLHPDSQPVPVPVSAGVVTENKGRHGGFILLTLIATLLATLSVLYFTGIADSLLERVGIPTWSVVSTKDTGSETNEPLPTASAGENTAPNSGVTPTAAEAVTELPNETGAPNATLP